MGSGIEHPEGFPELEGAESPESAGDHFPEVTFTAKKGRSDRTVMVMSFVVIAGILSIFYFFFTLFLTGSVRLSMQHLIPADIILWSLGLFGFLLWIWMIRKAWWHFCGRRWHEVRLGPGFLEVGKGRRRTQIPYAEVDLIVFPREQNDACRQNPFLEIRAGRLRIQTRLEACDVECAWELHRRCPNASWVDISGEFRRPESQRIPVKNLLVESRWRFQSAIKVLIFLVATAVFGFFIMMKVLSDGINSINGRAQLFLFLLLIGAPVGLAKCMSDFRRASRLAREAREKKMEQSRGINDLFQPWEE